MTEVHKNRHLVPGNMLNRVKGRRFYWMNTKMYQSCNNCAFSTIRKIPLAAIPARRTVFTMISRSSLFAHVSEKNGVQGNRLTGSCITFYDFFLWIPAKISIMSQISFNYGRRGISGPQIYDLLKSRIVKHCALTKTRSWIDKSGIDRRS